MAECALRIANQVLYGLSMLFLYIYIYMAGWMGTY